MTWTLEAMRGWPPSRKVERPGCDATQQTTATGYCRRPEQGFADKGTLANQNDLAQAAGVGPASFDFYPREMLCETTEEIQMERLGSAWLVGMYETSKSDHHGTHSRG
jgi:hypothetical protein